MPRKSRKRRPITPEDLLRLTLPSCPRMAPDGRRIVFVHRSVGEKNDYCSRLWMVGTDGESAEPFTRGPRDSSPRWSPSGETIAFLRTDEAGATQVHVIPAGGGEGRILTRFPEGSLGGLAWAPDGRSLAVNFRAQGPDWTRDAQDARKKSGESDPPRVIEKDWYRLDGDGYFEDRRYELYLVDAASGEHRKIYSGDTFGSVSFDFSPTSRELVVATNRDRRAMVRPWKTELLRIDVASGKRAKIPGLPPGPKTSVAWSPDGKLIAYAGREGHEDIYSTENLELFVCDPRRGNARSLTGSSDYCLLAAALADSAEVDFSPRLEFLPSSTRILMKLGIEGETHIASVPTKGGKVTILTRGPLDQELGTLSSDGKKLALTVASPIRPPEVAVASVKARELTSRIVTDFGGPLTRELELVRPRSVWIQAADGHRSQCWVLEPPGPRRKKRRPAILEIHGGPHAMYGSGFFHELQLLAARGYVVFYSNPRGSKGYGRDHCAAIHGKWGDRDWVDIQAVIEHMKSHRCVDASRMGVMGGSYGGYMTNWTIGHCHDFAGAITDRCVSNLVSMAGNSDFMSAPDQYFPGNFWDRPEARWEQSPIQYFGSVRTPTLIIHSEGDLRCNIEQSEQVFTALKLRDVPCRFVRYPRSTSHGMSRGGPPDLRLHRLREILAWWKRWLA